MTTKTAGIHSYVLYGVETDYGTAVTTNKVLGINTNFAPNLNNNINVRSGGKTSTTEGRRPTALVPGRATVSHSIDFDVVDFAWAEFAMGSVSGTTTKTYSFGNTTKSLTVSDNIEDSTDRIDKYTGSVIQSVTVKGIIDSPITANLSFDGASIIKGTTLDTPVALSNTQPYNFVGSSIEFPDGSTIADVIEGFDVTINNNYTLLYGSSRTATSATVGVADFNFQLTTKRVDDDLWEHQLGTSTGISSTTPETEATLIINLIRGSDNVALKLMGTVIPSEYSGNRQHGQPIGANHTFLATNMNIVEALA